MIKRSLKFSLIFLLILGVSFSNIPFYAVSGLIDFYEKTSSIVDKIWLLEQSHNSDIVDNFSPLKKFAKKLEIPRAMAAISIRNTGAYVSGIANLTPVIPATAASGDMMLMAYGTKPYNDAPTIDQGWTSIGSATDGTVAAGVDVGSMQTRIYYKQHTGSETNPTVTNGTNNVSGAVIIVFQKGASETWEIPVGAGNGDATAGTGFSVTAASNPGITANDMIVGYAAIRSDAGTQSAIGITATGATMGTFTESPATDLATASGGDMAMSGGYRSVTAGTATAAPVYASTLAAAHTGSAFIVRLRATAAAATTTLATNTDPTTATVAPGSGIRDAGAFSLVTSAGTDSISALTVTLAGSGTPYDGLSEARITSNDGATLYFAAVSTFSSNSVNFSGGTPIPASTTTATFKIRLTPKTHLNMPAVPGASYALSPYVSAWTNNGTNTKAGSDTNPNTLTIDNTSPTTATNSGTNSAGGQKVTINWTTSASSDFSRSVVLRWAASTPGSEVPAEGTDYTVGNTITTATVACVRTADAASTAVVNSIDGAGGTADCNNTALTNGQAYSYKVFSKDSNGNYDAGLTLTGSPFTPQATLTIGVTAGSVVTTKNSGDASQYAHNTACTSGTDCAAFTLTASGGTVNLSSITITESSTSTTANTELANAKLWYDTNGNWSDAETETQYGATSATFNVSEKATFSAALGITSGTTYYFYVQYDLANVTTYPRGGATVSFQIAANTDVASDGTETGAPQTLNGTQTVLPVITSVTYAVGGDGGRSGAAPVISGKGFGVAPVGSRGNCAGAVNTGCMRFNVGGSATVATGDVSAWTDTSITFNVIAGLASDGGASGLEVVAGSQGTPTDFTYYVYPTVGAISGGSFSDGGYQDGTFTVNGDHLGSSGAASNIAFTGAINPASIGVWSSTSVTLVDIPNSGADSGTFTVTRASDSKASNASATFYIYPQITSYTSARTDGDIQTGTITISGNHFGTGGIASDVTINTVASESLTWTSSSSLTSVAIPDGGADSGTITVRNPQTTKTSNTCGNATCSGGSFYIYPHVTGTTVCNKTTTPAWPTDAAREYASGDSACPNNLKDGHIIINGTHFGSAGSVTIHGSAATQETIATAPCTSAYSATCITVQVPAVIADNSYTGNIVVTRTAGSVSYTYSSLRVLPRIASTGPVNLKGARGDTGVSVTGDHLCQSGTCPTAFSTINKVSFTGADVTSGASTWTDTSAPSITIPAAASDGALSVLSNTDYVSNNLTYDVKFKPDATAGGLYTNRAPANAATGQSKNPGLTGVTFADGAGDSDTHIATDWQAAHNSDADWATPEWTRSAGSAETATTVNTTNGTFANGDAGQTELDCGTVYKWRYRYKDNGGVSSAEWSDYSADWTFTTTSCGPDATSMSNSTEGGLTNGGRGSQTIVLTGSAFGTVNPGSRATCAGGAGTGCIKVGGTGGPTLADVDVTAWSNTSITFVLPAGVASYGGATTSGVIVYAAGVTDSNGLTFYVYPDITSLSASEAREGDTITINGNHFGTAAGANTVTIDGVTATGCTWGAGSLTGCVIPDAISDSNDSVTIRVYQGTGGNNAIYDDSTGFGLLPKITSISAASFSDGGYQDGTFTVNGSHFGTSQGTGNVSVNTVNQDGTVTWGASTITGVGIPNTGADSGSIVVTRNDAKTSNSFSTFYIYPQITSYTAANADGGIQTGTITISGNHFGTGGLASNISINGVAPSTIGTWSATSVITVDIPDSGTDSGTITVTNPQTSKASNASATFVIYPDIASLTVPTAFTDASREYDAGDSDGVITINGSHLGAAGTITVAGSAATQQTTGTCTGSAYQATCAGIQIPTVIANTTYTGNIVLTRTSDSKTDTYSGFRILPRITGNSPTSGFTGDRVKITGDHFCQTGTCPVSPNRSAAADNVKFGSTQAADSDFMNSGAAPCSGNVQAWTDTEICINVPSATPTGSQPTLATSNSYTSNTKAFTRSTTVPNDPDLGPGTDKGQYRSDVSTTIATGGTTNQTMAVFKMLMSSPGNATLIPQVEVKAVGTAFDGTTGLTNGTSVSYTGTPVTGSSSPSGLTNLTNYHWRARVQNQSTSEYSNWVNFGGNTENPPTNPAAADIYVDTAAPNITSVSAGSPTDIAATITWTTGTSSNSSVTLGTTSCVTGTGSPTTNSDASNVTSHSIAFSALSPSTAYYYRVKSTDLGSNIAFDPATITTNPNDCRTFTTAAPVKRLVKTTDYFVFQDTTSGAPSSVTKTYKVFVSEYDATNTKAVTLKSAYVEVFGTVVASATWSMSVQVSSPSGNSAVTYNFPSTGGVPVAFNIIYPVSALNYAYGSSPDVTNTLDITFPSAPTSISNLGAKQFFTYHYTP